MISPTYGQLELKEVVNKIADYINKNGNNVKYKFIIGTDSQVYGNNIVYVTVVACCCVGHGESISMINLRYLVKYHYKKDYTQKLR